MILTIKSILIFCHIFITASCPGDVLSGLGHSIVIRFLDFLISILDTLQQSDDPRVLRLNLLDHLEVGVADQAPILVIVASRLNKVHRTLPHVDSGGDGPLLYHFGHVALERLDWQLCLLSDLAKAQRQVGCTEVSNLLLDQTLEHELGHAKHLFTLQSV